MVLAKLARVCALHSEASDLRPVSAYLFGVMLT